MKKILFIINPISGTGKKKTIEKLAPKILGADFLIQYCYTNAPKHATSISVENADKYDIIVAVGGDGTINEVATGLIGTNCSMAIIPRGSGNGFARFLKIPRSLVKALETIKYGQPFSIDTATINDKKFVNISGVGFDAEVGFKFATYGKRGAIPYLQIIFKEFHTYPNHHYQMEIDGKPIQHDAFMICVANSSQWGLNAHIAPKAQINDGKLDVSVVKKFPLHLSIPLAIQLFGKQIDKSNYVETYSAKHIVIKNNHELKAHIDGEPILFNEDVIINIVPKSLNVIIY